MTSPPSRMVDESFVQRAMAERERVSEWCGAGLYTPVYADDGIEVVAESRRMCGLKEPHEWHQDRFDKAVRWKALPPLATRQNLRRSE